MSPHTGREQGEGLGSEQPREPPLALPVLWSRFKSGQKSQNDHFKMTGKEADVLIVQMRDLRYCRVAEALGRWEARPPTPPTAEGL